MGSGAHVPDSGYLGYEISTHVTKREQNSLEFESIVNIPEDREPDLYEGF